MAANKPGISWGVNLPINLLPLDKGIFVAMCYGDCPPRIIEIFRPKTIGEKYNMYQTLAEWNYGPREVNCAPMPPAPKPKLDL
jgi:hypothetical protein